MASHLQNLLVLKSKPSLCILFVSATFFLKPNPSPFLAITTIPLLVHLSHSHKTKTYISLCLPVLFCTTTTVDFLASSRYLVPHASQALAAQSVLSLLKSMVITVMVAVHRRMRKKSGVDLGLGGWQAAMGFGLLWAGAWQLWELMSPLGRFDTPSPLPSSASFIRPLHRMTGAPGVDLLLGTAGYLVSQIADIIWPYIESALWDVLHRSKAAPIAQQDEPLVSVHSRSAPRRSLSLQDESTPEDESASPSLARQRQIRGIKIFAALMVITYIALSAYPISAAISQSTSIDKVTPFTISCALPYASSLLPLDHYIYQSQTLGALSRLIVWPEGAVRLPTRAAREDGIAQVSIRVCRRYGVWVLMGAETSTENTVGSRGEKKTLKEAILVGPQGEVGSYDKQKLVPFVESYGITKGALPAPLWTLALPPLPRMNKTDWTPLQPHIRPFTITPLICLDTFHPSLVNSRNASSLPSLIIIPASSPSAPLSPQIVSRAQSLSVAHGIPSFICSTSRGNSGAGISALIDRWGRIMYQQTGGESFTVRLVVTYLGQGHHRMKTGWELLGPSGVLLAFTTVLVIGKAFSVIAVARPRSERRTKGLMEQGKDWAMGLWGHVTGDENAPHRAAYGAMEEGEAGAVSSVSGSPRSIATGPTRGSWISGGSDPDSKTLL